ncbi:MAG TPA: quinolinate phosphoribosyl transferase [Negativicutes bacterium]|nr:quinolinate phosphoribosyl transferase [Negativicutes bacterium]
MLIGTETMLIDSLAAGLREDCPYGDITTELLSVEGPGTFSFISRVDAVVSGTPRLGEFFAAKNVAVASSRRPGERIQKGDTIIEAAGDIKTLFKLWRISQTYLTVLCAIATQTDKIVRAAREENGGVEIVVASRKAHLGMRSDEMQAVLDGGALYHRNSLSDTILITQNHLRVLGALPDKLYSFHHKIEFEPSSPEEAFRYAGSVDVMLLDHFAPEELGAIARKLRVLNPRLLVGVAGGITLANVKSFAPHVDIIVLSSVLYAPPLDITCKITRL